MKVFAFNIHRFISARGHHQQELPAIVFTSCRGLTHRRTNISDKKEDFILVVIYYAIVLRYTQGL
jgi:hypothetical protein